MSEQSSFVDPKILRDLNIIGRIQSFPFIPSRYENILQFLDPISERAQAAGRFGKIPEKEVLLIQGLPNAGKTRLTDFTEDYFSWWYSRFDSRYRQLRRLGWEEHGEKVAREKGLIATKPGSPFTDKELLSSQRELKKFVIRALHDKRTEVVLVESPGGIAYRTSEDTMIGMRRLGADLAYDLARKLPPFDRYDYHLNICTVIGGPLMPKVMAYFREDINMIDHEKSLFVSEKDKLDEARRLAYLYGYKRKGETPLSKSEWDRLRNGASLRQIRYIDELMAKMLQVLKKRYMPPLYTARYSELVHSHDPYLKALSEVEKGRVAEGKEGISPIYHWDLPWFWQKFLTDQHNLALPEDRIFLAFNDPHPHDLGIDNKEQFFMLLNHLRNRTVYEEK